MPDTDDRPTNEQGESLNKDGSISKRQPVSSAKVVAYIGTSDIRTIRESDWDNVNIKGEDRRWSQHNGWQIPVDNFSDDELAYFETDDDFVIKNAVIPGL